MTESFTATGQPAGKRSAIGAMLTPEQQPDKARALESTPPKKPAQVKKPAVQETSEESFPASDPPAWNGTMAHGGEREVGGD